MAYPTTPWTSTPTPPTTSWTDADPTPANDTFCDFKVAHDGGQRWKISDVFDLICQIEFLIQDLDSGTSYSLTP